MDWLSQRQNMLADTIADADTPDYLTHDLNPVAARHVRADHRPAALVNERFIGRQDDGRQPARTAGGKATGRLAACRT